MRAYEFLKSGFQTWVALCNLILYTVIAESLFIYRIDSELQIYKIKFEAYLNIFFLYVYTVSYILKSNLILMNLFQLIVELLEHKLKLKLDSHAK